MRGFQVEHNKGIRPLVSIYFCEEYIGEYVALDRRDFGIDALRSFAVLLIVLVHTLVPGFYSYGPHFNVDVFCGSPARAGVPLFFMISGALLLNREHEIRAILRRVRKITVPLMIWSLIYLAADRSRGVVHQNWLLTIARASVAPHLWFLYSMIAAYLVLPMLAGFHQVVTRTNRILVLTSWFVFASVVPAIAGWTQPFLAIDATFFPLYAGYILLGATLYGVKPSKRVALFSFALIMAGWLLTFWLTLRHSDLGHKPSELLYWYWSPNVVISAIGFFLLFRCIPAPPLRSPVAKATRFFSTTSFGVYLSHWLLVGWANRNYGAFLTDHASWAPVALAFETVIACSLLTAVIQRIPYVRTICPAS